MINFKYDKSTKTTHRFAEVVPEGGQELIGSLYVKKSAFSSQPASLVITLTAFSQDAKEISIKA